MAAGSTVASYVGQQQSVKDQNAYQKEMQRRVTTLALGDYRRTIDSLDLRLDQERSVAVQDQMVNTAESNKVKASAQVAAGEANVAGNSVNALMHDFDAQASANKVILSNNLGMLAEQLQMDKLASQSDALSRIAGAQPAPIRGPSLAASAMTVGSQLLSGYDNYKYRTDPNYGRSSWQQRTIGSAYDGSTIAGVKGQ